MKYFVMVSCKHFERSTYITKALAKSMAVVSGI